MKAIQEQGYAEISDLTDEEARALEELMADFEQDNQDVSELVDQLEEQKLQSKASDDVVLSDASESSSDELKDASDKKKQQNNKKKKSKTNGHVELVIPRQQAEDWELEQEKLHDKALEESIMEEFGRVKPTIEETTIQVLQMVKEQDRDGRDVGYSFVECLAMIRKVHGPDASTINSVRWYRSKINCGEKPGKVPPKISRAPGKRANTYNQKPVLQERNKED